MPVFLKSVVRIEALLTVYFLALLVSALIEREIRRTMKTRGIEFLPLYPEERLCRAPTTDRLLDLLSGLKKINCSMVEIRSRYFNQRSLISKKKFWISWESDPPPIWLATDTH